MILKNGSVHLKPAEIPRPTPQQLAWQKMEMAAFAHFGPNTFTDREWGDGTEDPGIFDPSELDAGQWVRSFSSAGMGMLIVTAKHHDGFCLWPSRLTEHSVRSSPWMDGKGDVVGEVSEACRREGMGFGIYLSPWDRHEETYGTAAYNRYFLGQLRELLTGYGPVAEVWFDGACGEGPNGRKQEYDWGAYYRLVRDLQPQALIAICGPDIRWVGNESGVAGEDEASSQQVPRDDESPLRDYQVPWLGGRAVWWPAECDVSIRPGWFYHGKEDSKVRTTGQLIQIYLSSVGRNSNLLLNAPPDRRGLIHEEDQAHLRDLGKEVRSLFGSSLAETSGEGRTVRLSWSKPERISYIMVQEDISRGERISEYVIQGHLGTWKDLSKGRVVGHKRITPLEETELDAIRIIVKEAKGTPRIDRLAVFGPEDREKGDP